MFLTAIRRMTVASSYQLGAAAVGDLEPTEDLSDDRLDGAAGGRVRPPAAGVVLGVGLAELVGQGEGQALQDGVFEVHV
jgi:hypothetical protein